MSFDNVVHRGSRDARDEVVIVLILLRRYVSVVLQIFVVCGLIFV